MRKLQNLKILPSGSERYLKGISAEERRGTRSLLGGRLHFEPYRGDFISAVFPLNPENHLDTSSLAAELGSAMDMKKVWEVVRNLTG